MLIRIKIYFIVITVLSVIGSFVYSKERYINLNNHYLFKQVVIFGDSLSDQGGERGRRDRFLAEGFLNQNYVEIITPLLTGKESLPNVLGGNNYAQSDARTSRSNRNLNKQVENFLDNSHHQVDPKALILINIGGNDLKDLEGGIRYIINYVGSLILPIPFSMETNEDPKTIVKEVEKLHQAGARSIMVANLWDMSLFPFLTQVTMSIWSAIGSTFNEETGNFLRFLSSIDISRRNSNISYDHVTENNLEEQSINILYSQFLWLPKFLIEDLYQFATGFAKTYSEEYYNIVQEGLEKSNANVLFVNTRALYNEIYTDPKKFGIDDVVLTACNLGISASDPLCDFPLFYYDNKSYLWSDWLHPSPEANEIIADYMLSLLSAPIYTSSLYYQVKQFNDHSFYYLDEQLKTLKNDRHNVEKKWNVFISYSGSQRKYDSYIAHAKIKSNTVNFGYYFPLNGKNILGFMFSLGHEKVKPFKDYSFSYDGLGLSLFHQLFHDKFWLNNSLIITSLRIKNIERTIQLRNLIRKEYGDKTHAQAIQVNTKMGYDLFQPNQNIKIGPFARFAYSQYKVRGFKDREDNSTSMRFGRISHNQPTVSLGLYFNYLSDLSEKNQWNASTSIAYNQTSKKPLIVPSNVKIFSRDYKMNIENSINDKWLSMTTSFNYKPHEKTNLGLSFQYEKYRKSNKNLSYSIGINHQF